MRVYNRSVGIVLLITGVGFVFASHASAAGASRSRAQAPRTRTAKTPGTAPDQRVYHKVLRGQTLYSIAREHGVPLKTLAAANKISNPANIRAGMRLLIPGARRSPAAAARAVPIAKGPVAKVTAANVPHTSVPVATTDQSTPIAAPRDNERVYLTAPLEWPVEGQVVSAFARPRRGHRHKGIDIKSDEGAPIRAVADGTVTRVEERYGSYGRLIVIEHENGMESYYGHNKQNLVSVGQTVTAEQTIGLVGHAGNATCDHLHFELHVRGQAVDPMPALASLPAGPARVIPREPLVTSSKIGSAEPAAAAAPGTRR